MSNDTLEGCFAGDTKKLLAAICHVVPELGKDQDLVEAFLETLSTHNTERSIPGESIEPLAEVLSFLVKAELEASRSE